MKDYKVAPLPFQGQKRNFVEPFKKALRELKEKQDITIIVDLFGGSGLLSHTAKSICPETKVIYNDYDDYHVRLNTIPKINALINDIRAILGSYPRESKIPRSIEI